MANDKKPQMDPMLRLVEQVSKKFLNIDERLSSIVQSNIRQIVKAGLGLTEDRWSNKREIKLYCTNGLRTALHDLVETIVRRDVAEHAEKVFNEIFAEKQYKKDFVKSFEKHFEYEYSQAFSKELGRLVTDAANKAETQFNEECQGLGNAMDGVLAPIVKAARAKVLDEMARRAENGSRIGDHESKF